MSDSGELVNGAIQAAATALVGAGDWLTAEQRRAAWNEARLARTNELDQARRAAISPHAVDGEHQANDWLAAEAVEVIHRIASDPGRLTRSWADAMIAALGEETYTELVGVAAISAALDTMAFALHDAESAMGSAVGGRPAQQRPDNVGDVGAWVDQSTDGGTANVSRSLSLVPVTNQVWVRLVQALYSRGEEFFDLEWDRALSRPQTELVAARTTAELECFY